MAFKKKHGRRPEKKISMCRHCKQLFEEELDSNAEYCSNECYFIYNPKPTGKSSVVPAYLQNRYSEFRNLRSVLRPLKKHFRQSVIAQIKDVQGLHEFELKDGVKEAATAAEIAEIKKDLRASYLDAVEQMKLDRSHLSESDIDAKVDELFEFIQTFTFIKSKND